MLVIAVILAYIIGSIPTGLWLGLRLRGVDIREHGSRNIGATNTMRVLGKSLGAIALTCDVGKGLLAVLLISRLTSSPYGPLACGLAAIIGHTASLFVRFRGGKGVATAAGVFLALCPLPVLIALVVFICVVATTRMVSAGSIAAALTLVVAVLLFPNPIEIRIIVILVAALVIWKHRTNIQRICKGQENRIGRSKDAGCSSV